MAKINLPIWYLKEKYWELREIWRAMSTKDLGRYEAGVLNGREIAIMRLLNDAGYNSNIDDIKDL